MLKLIFVAFILYLLLRLVFRILGATLFFRFRRGGLRTSRKRESVASSGRIEEAEYEVLETRLKDHEYHSP